MVMNSVTKITPEWQYDQDDHGTAVAGEEPGGQVSQVKDKLFNRIAKIIDGVQTKLINDEYYSG